jgi:hypothetical protein
MKSNFKRIEERFIKNKKPLNPRRSSSSLAVMSIWR